MEAIPVINGRAKGNCREDRGSVAGDTACVGEDVTRFGRDSFSTFVLLASTTGPGVARAAPHWLQNRLILGLAALQTGHSTESSNTPQPPQNNASGRLLKPQEWQPSMSE